MQIVFLGIVFLVIVILLALRRPLYQAILGALIAAVLLYRIPPKAILSQSARVFTDWNSFSVLVSLYLITYLQRMLEARSQIKLAQLDLNGLFHNRRVNAAGAPLFIGLLPSAAAMILCADIVKDSTDGYLDPKEQAFVTSWFRHIPESTLPTYTGVLLMASLSGQPLGRFMLGMIIPMLILALVGYFPYFLRLPRDPGTPRSENRARDALNLVKHLWSLLLILVLILAFDFQVVTAVLTVIVLAAFMYRFSFAELKGFLVSAFEVKLLLNTFLILVLKEFISYTGVLTLLPAVLSTLPIPEWLDKRQQRHHRPRYAFGLFRARRRHTADGAAHVHVPRGKPYLPGACLPRRRVGLLQDHHGAAYTQDHPRVLGVRAADDRLLPAADGYSVMRKNKYVKSKP